MDSINGAAAALAKASMVVIKVGSALLVDEEKNRINDQWLAGIAADIAALRVQGKSVAVVSSGAIALGRRVFAFDGATLRLEEKQAAAAAGQVILANAWMTALARHDINTAQILLSPDDTETRRRHLNARATMKTLLELGAVPVVNENDTVATAEIRYGDNDRLAARVAAMVSAEMLILLSDVDGLYSANPHQNPDAVHLAEVETLNQDILKMAGAANASYASGGMVTKLEAARIAIKAGCGMVICDGRLLNPITKLQAGARSTFFHATSSPPTARKQWIAGALRPKGILTVDAGATQALSKGRSLLPAGVVKADGEFERGDLIAIQTLDGAVVAHGLSAYSAADAKVICGHKSREIEALLGYRGRDEIVHADNLVIVDMPA